MKYLVIVLTGGVLISAGATMSTLYSAWWNVLTLIGGMMLGHVAEIADRRNRDAR